MTSGNLLSILLLSIFLLSNLERHELEVMEMFHSGFPTSNGSVNGEAKFEVFDSSLRLFNKSINRRKY